MKATNLTVTPDLSFQAHPTFIADTFRAQIRAIAQSVHIHLNAILACMGHDQLQQAISLHKETVWWLQTKLGVRKARLIGITPTRKDGGVKFSYEFADTKGELLGEHRLENCDIVDIINFLETLERVRGC